MSQMCMLDPPLKRRKKSGDSREQHINWLNTITENLIVFVAALLLLFYLVGLLCFCAALAQIS